MAESQRTPNIDGLKFMTKSLAVMTSTLDLQIFCLERIATQGETLRSAERLTLLGREITSVTLEDLRRAMLGQIKVAIQYTQALLSDPHLPNTLKFLQELEETLRSDTDTEEPKQ